MHINSDTAMLPAPKEVSYILETCSIPIKYPTNLLTQAVRKCIG